MTIKAIETSYKDNPFRSRLEARWAVFFDTLGLQWDYEPEGFDLNGLWYLPDFFIKSWNCYAEIKPDVPDNINHADEVCRRFAISTQKEIVLLMGQPCDNLAVIYEGIPEPERWQEYEARDKLKMVATMMYHSWNTKQNYMARRTLIDLSKLTGFHSASLSAKRARFEHGETP